jgi:hypothetical protein
MPAIRTSHVTTLVLLTCSVGVQGCPVSTVLSCPDIYTALVSRIRCVGSKCPARIAPAACMQDKLMRRVLTWAEDAGVPAFNTTTATVTWNASCTQLADLAALSMLGRAFVETQSPEAVFFEFNTGSGALHLRPLGCEFQRPLYTVVLLTALFTLSFVLVSHHLQDTHTETGKTT